jgi:hypothetical protein
VEPKIGERYVLHYNKGNINNKLIEIKAIVDKDYYVIKSRHGYSVEYKTWFEVNKSSLHLQRTKGKS